MELATRYARLLEVVPPRFRDEPRREGAAASGTVAEIEVQARWFAGEYGTEFRTVAGQALKIVQFGVWNREAGPDFTEAAISLDGGAPLRGSIEIDRDPRDWERHGHAANPAYENVVLHVFCERAPAGEAAFFTRTPGHRNVPQLHLDFRADEQGQGQLPAQTRLPALHAKGGFLQSQPIAIPGRCVAPLRALAPEKAREVIEGAAQYRLQRKAARFARLCEIHGHDEALYQLLAGTLGYKANKLPFTLLAQRLPLRLLVRRGADADALLFGVSGFLPGDDLARFDRQTKSYVRGLWEKWWSCRAEFDRLRIEPALWRSSGQRPANHPQRRLAALAGMVRHWPKVRSLAAVAGNVDARAAESFFESLRDEYWDHHYTLTSRPSAARMALIGKSRATEILLNVLFPQALLLAGPEPEPEAQGVKAAWERIRLVPAAGQNKRVEIAAIRLLGGGPETRRWLRSAVHQQGLLQIYEDFCMRDDSGCARCPFPEQLAQWH